MVDLSVLHCLAGYWNVTVYGRKHCYRLYTKLLNEATRWSSAIQNVTDTKAPIDTPTQQLIQDIKVGREAQELLMDSWSLPLPEKYPVFLQLSFQCLVIFQFRV